MKGYFDLSTFEPDIGHDEGKLIKALSGSNRTEDWFKHLQFCLAIIFDGDTYIYKQIIVFGIIGLSLLN